MHRICLILKLIYCLFLSMLDTFKFLMIIIIEMILSCVPCRKFWVNSWLLRWPFMPRLWKRTQRLTSTLRILMRKETLRWALCTSTSAPQGAAGLSLSVLMSNHIIFFLSRDVPTVIMMKALLSRVLSISPILIRKRNLGGILQSVFSQLWNVQIC